MNAEGGRNVKTATLLFLMVLVAVVDRNSNEKFNLKMLNVIDYLFSNRFINYCTLLQNPTFRFLFYSHLFFFLPYPFST